MVGLARRTSKHEKGCYKCLLFVDLHARLAHHTEVLWLLLPAESSLIFVNMIVADLCAYMQLFNCSASSQRKSCLFLQSGTPTHGLSCAFSLKFLAIASREDSTYSCPWSLEWYAMHDMDAVGVYSLQSQWLVARSCERTWCMPQRNACARE